MDISANDQGLDALIPNESASVPNEPASVVPNDTIGIRALTIAALDHVLIHELAAAEAYHQTSPLFDKTQVATLLQVVTEGHQHRSIVLREAILARQGIPTESQVQDHNPTLVSTDVRQVLAMLLDLEMRGVAAYRQTLRQLDDLTRTLIEADLLPAQERALATLTGAQPPSPDGAV